MQNCWKVLLLVSVLFLSASVWADSGVSNTIHHQYVSPRALGMGNAFVAVANDYNALFYNPAGLARLENGEVNLSMDFGATDSFSAFAKDVSNAAKTTGTEAEKQTAVAAAVQKVYGKTFGFNAGLFNAVWARPHWGVGFQPAQFSSEMAVHNGVGPVLNTTIYMDSILTLGYGDHVRGNDFGGKLEWGIAGKFVNRGYFSKGLTIIELAADPNLLKTSDLQEGYTVDADVGLLWRPYVPETGFWSIFQLTRPTFGFVARNVGEMGFNQSLKAINKTKTEAPEKLYRVFDFGSRWEYPAFWIFGGRGVLDIRDVGHPFFTMKKGLHLGFEFDWSMASWWRGNYRVGLNQGYWTAGASAMFTIFNLDLVSYGEDVGTFGTAKENRIYMLKMSMNF
ncbi:MAG: hypothetical protein JNM39_04790 [Bdellovibrionaceae bacterium]|nr:hypothetical protein [Pseudobdellovibrionaceae bacterium]